MEETNKETRIAVYKWIKIIQSVLLLILGFAMVLIAVIRREKDAGTTKEAISYCVGTALTLYGVINILSGYFLNRSPIDKEVIMGLGIATFGISFLVKNEILTELFPFLVIILLYGFGTLLITHATVRLTDGEKNPETGKKTINSRKLLSSILLYIAAAALIAAATVYIFYYDNGTVLDYVLIGLGAILFALGIASLVILLIKVHNTKLMEKEKRIKEEQELATKEDITTKETKIIDISELRKKNGKKVHNKQIADTTDQQDNKIPTVFLDKPKEEDNSEDVQPTEENASSNEETIEEEPKAETKKRKNNN